MKLETIISDLFNRSISFKDNKRLQKFVLVVTLFIVIYGLLVIVSMPARIDLTVGRPSPRTVYAPRDAIDEYTTERLRVQAAESVAEVFDYDLQVLEKALVEIGAFFDTIVEVKDDEDLEDWEKVEALRKFVPEDLPSSTIYALFIDRATLRDLQGRLNNSVSELFGQGIKENDTDLARRRLNQEIALYPFSADLKRVVEALVESKVVQNMYYNAQTTEENRELARQQIEPVIILRNTLIVSEGEPVTVQQMAQLEGLGFIRGQQIYYAGYIGLFFLLMIVFILIGVYMSIFVTNVFTNPSLLLLMGIVIIITLILSVAATYFSSYLMPVAMGIILLTVLFGYKLAVIINL
ncbi:MAG: hypothetical protein MUP57_03465, partial [Clostridia bacterium]|nr:hypothetical protein [Clostridia bacterium]